MSLHLFSIDNELRTVLYELEYHLDIKFSEAVFDKIFADSEDFSPLNGERIYTLYQSSDFWFAWVIEGIVEEHEPETI